MLFTESGQTNFKTHIFIFTGCFKVNFVSFIKFLVSLLVYSDFYMYHGGGSKMFSKGVSGMQYMIFLGAYRPLFLMVFVFKGVKNHPFTLLDPPLYHQTPSFTCRLRAAQPISVSYTVAALLALLPYKRFAI